MHISIGHRRQSTLPKWLKAVVPKYWQEEAKNIEFVVKTLVIVVKTVEFNEKGTNDNVTIT